MDGWRWRACCEPKNRLKSTNDAEQHKNTHRKLIIQPDRVSFYDTFCMSMETATYIYCLYKELVS